MKPILFFSPRARLLLARLPLTLGSALIALRVIVTTVSCAQTQLQPPPFPSKNTLNSVPVTGGPQGCQASSPVGELSATDSESSEGDRAGDTVAIPPGKKRFRFSIGRTVSEVGLSIDEAGSFYKGSNSTNGCFVVDLTPGKWRVWLQGRERDRDDGLQAGLLVEEFSPKTGRWYSTFKFACGGEANACDADAMLRWVQFQSNLSKGLLDPCGATRIEKVSYVGDDAHSAARRYSDIALQFVMNIYKFVPYREPYSPSCKRDESLTSP